MISKPTYYWDACLFYEVLGDEPVGLQKKEAIDELLQDNMDGKNFIITSVLTHLEIIPSKLEQKKPGAEASYLDLFDGEKFLDYEINRNILLRAREIRDFYYRPETKDTPAKVMDAADAVHLATASIYGVEAFHTRDDDTKGTKIPLVSLHKWSGHDKLCGKYPLNIVSPENAQGALNLVPPTVKPSANAPPDSKPNGEPKPLDQTKAHVVAAKVEGIVIPDAAPPTPVETPPKAPDDVKAKPEEPSKAG